MPSMHQVYEQICDFAQNRGVDRVVLFGSRARGEEMPRSDIDLAVEGGDVDGFYEDVEERLWSLLSVDVIDLGEPVSQELRKEIERDGRVLYEAV